MIKNTYPARIFKLLLFLFASNLTFIFAPSASSQITPDNTLGAERSVVAPNTNVRGLPATLIQGGATRGVNLFQSFSQFNVGDAQRVYFSNPQGIQNILSRITGGDPSRIFGTLGVDGKANLFFLNPNGIIFGPNARLDVAGSFFASTANSFVFDNGLQFSATNPEAPPLITVSIRPGLQFGANSSTISNTGNLQTGQDLTLAGVKLDLQGKLEAGKDLTLSATDTVKVRDTATNPFIASAGGKLLLQGNQNVDIFALNNPNSGFFSGSDMVLRSASTVGGDAHYWANGNFRIEKLDGNLGNLFSPFDPVIRASGDVSVGDYTGASLHILAGGSVTLGTVDIIGADLRENTLSGNVTLSDGTSLQINGATQPTLDIRAGTTDFGTPGVTPANLGSENIYSPVPNPLNNSISPTISNQTQTQGAKISIGGINVRQPDGQGQVFLTNQYQPNTNLPEGLIEITGTSPNSSVGAYSITAFGSPVSIDSRGSVRIAEGIVTGSRQGTGGDIKILSNGNIQVSDNDIRSGRQNNFRGSLTSIANNGKSGNITLNSRNGNINVRRKIGSWANVDTAGNISLQANGNITIEDEIASRIIDNGTGTAGTVDINSINGNINLLTEAEIASNSEFIREITSSTLSGKGGTIRLNAPQGQINTTGWTIRPQSQDGLAGNVTIEAGNDIRIGNIEASSNSSSNETFNTVTIQSNQGSVFLNNSRISTSNSGSGLAGDISITALNQLLISTENSNQTRGIFSQGDFGRIFIGKSDRYASFSPQRVEIQNSNLSTTNLISSQQQTNNVSSIDSGPISIDTGSLLLNGASINTNTVRRGNAGNITINATNGGVDLNNSSISSQVLSGENLLPRDILNPQPEEFRNGGDINITARSFKLDNNSQINAFVNSSNSDLNGQDRPFGNAGNININVGSGNFEINAAPNSTGITGIFSTLGNGAEVGFTNATGRGGDITITSGSMSINGTTNETRANAGIAAKTFGIGNAGKIEINTGSLTVQNGGFIDNGTTRNGNGGPINITAQSINLANDNPNRRAIQSAVQAGTEKGNGGDIFINTGSLSLSNAAIDASTFGNGNAGIINITANNFEVRDGGQVRSSTNNSGEAGGIKLTVTDNITLSGSRQSSNLEDQNFYYLDNNLIPSGVFATTGESSTGKGGNISIDPELVTIEDGARIAVDSRGSGDAGQINLAANRLILDQGSITANTNNGNGGDITLSLEDLLLMRRDSLISTTAGQGNGNGGNITINGVPNSSPFIVTVPGENNDIIANARTGRDGRVTINAAGAFGFNALSRGDLERLDPINQNPRNLQTSDITAISSQSPVINQQDNLNSPESEISDTPINLPQNTVDASRLVPQRCEAFAGRGSEFVNAGNGGLPPRPDQPLSSDAVWKDTRLTVTQRPQKVPTATNTTRKTATVPIIPATGWVFNGKGEVTLVSKAPRSNSSLFNNTSCPVP
jgi:filamentous hemagglutinin family protein